MKATMPEDDRFIYLQREAGYTCDFPTSSLWKWHEIDTNIALHNEHHARVSRTARERSANILMQRAMNG
jgi:hypothetical protein